jgi:hypothetical protein
MESSPPRLCEKRNDSSGKTKEVKHARSGEVVFVPSKLGP